MAADADVPGIAMLVCPRGGEDGVKGTTAEPMKVSSSKLASQLGDGAKPERVRTPANSNA